MLVITTQEFLDNQQFYLDYIHAGNDLRILGRQPGEAGYVPLAASFDDAEESVRYQSDVSITSAHSPSSSAISSTASPTD